MFVHLIDYCSGSGVIRIATRQQAACIRGLKGIAIPTETVEEPVETAILEHVRDRHAGQEKFPS